VRGKVEELGPAVGEYPRRLTREQHGAGLHTHRETIIGPPYTGSNRPTPTPHSLSPALTDLNLLHAALHLLYQTYTYSTQPYTCSIRPTPTPRSLTPALPDLLRAALHLLYQTYTYSTQPDTCLTQTYTSQHSPMYKYITVLHVLHCFKCTSQNLTRTSHSLTCMYFAQPYM
jgi:hypothetical protein